MRPVRSWSKRSKGREPGTKASTLYSSAALGAEVDRQSRFVVLTGDAAVEIGVLFGLDIVFLPHPKGCAVGDVAGLHARLLDQ